VKTAGVIVAAGRGTRAGGGLPKQWRSLNGRAVAAWTLDAFRASTHIDQIILVLHPEDMGLAAGYIGHPDVSVVAGGMTRSASVQNGLLSLKDDPPDFVLIHDVARPLVSNQIIGDVIAALKTRPAAAPALAVTDALWKGAEGLVEGTQSREGLYRAQTPQGFHYEAILAAHKAAKAPAADDVEIARNAGLAVAIVPGDERNLKITLPEDFARAEQLMRQDLDIRVGNGYDVHKFGPGDHVILCGVIVPHDGGLVGHSDADVGLHTITDAIYGALAEGDIGQHFPPSEDEWKGADSRIFLEHATELARARGFEISNVDCTLVCELPKIGPHAINMRMKVSEIMELDHDRISVKATTSEKLGFTGRGEGIAAIATVTLVKS
jgi:2-C-methyl-D-erythritol 4-phosphate cytidylyltransferase/2-C-methyl-D-erythritol 2,4-cyclodiphosphate synthase